MIPAFDIHNFFDDLPAEIQNEFERVSKYRTVASGTTLVRIGEKRAYVHQLIQGEVKYCSYDSQGRETVTARMRCGDWIGLSEICTGEPAMANVVAMSNIHLRTIAGSDFEKLLDRHPVIARKLLRLFVMRFNLVYRLSQDRNELTLKQRLIKMLFALSREHPVIRMSQEDLGKLLAASRQAMNGLLKELEREGVLALGYRSIRVLGHAPLDREYVHLFDDNASEL